MELSKRRYSLTYVVVEDAVDHVWGFTGFDSDPEYQFVGTRAECARWIMANPDGSWKVIAMKEYESNYYEEEANA